MSNNGLPTGIKKTDVQSELKRINAMSDAALAREAAASKRITGTSMLWRHLHTRT